MRFVGYAMAFLAALGLASLAQAGDCYGVQQQFAPQYAPAGCGTCVQAQAFAAPVYQAQYAPVQQQVIVRQQVQYAPVVQQQFVQKQVIQRQVYVPQQQVFAQKQVVVRQQAVYGYGGGFQQQQFSRGFGGRQFNGGGFGGGGGPFRQGFAQGGLIGGLERFTGLGSGNGDFGRGAIIGVLGARSNLFGLGRR